MNYVNTKTNQDLKRVFRDHIKYLQNRLDVNKIVSDALVLYEYNQTLPHVVPDLRTSDEKLADLLELKAILVTKLREDGFMTDVDSEKTVFDLNDNEVRYLAQSIERLMKQYKESGFYTLLGVPSAVFLKEFRSNIIQSQRDENTSSKTDSSNVPQYTTKTFKPIYNKKQTDESRQQRGEANIERLKQKRDVELKRRRRIEPTIEPSNKRKIEDEELSSRKTQRTTFGRRMVGRGLKSVRDKSNYIEFGNKLINDKSLHNNILQLRYKNGGNIVKFPTRSVSTSLAKILRAMVVETSPNYEDIEKLSDDEKHYLNDLCNYVCLYNRFSLPTPSKDETSKQIDRLQILLGQLRAGNNNKAIVKEIKQLLLLLKSRRKLPLQEVNEIMSDLLYLEY